jgi:putative ABC transport system permease protein
MLWRKLLRDIRNNYGAYLACTSVIIIGLMMYVSFALILDVLKDQQQKYYAQSSFADGFAQISRGPKGLVDDISEIKGIDKVSGRIIYNVFINKPSGEENTTLRLVSFNVRQEVNRFRLESGKIPAEGTKEIFVSPAFLKGNSYRTGDKIPLVINGQEHRFTITGTANSPEYIYEIPNGLTITPDPKVFGIAFVPYSTIAPILGMEGLVNDISFTLNNGTKFEDIKTLVTRLLKNYGLISIIPRKDQLSHSMLTQEITGLEGSAKTTPVIFLAVAASILYIMLRRMVEQQRGQIGLLKAFGFSDWKIISHYLGYAVLVGGIGGLGGGLAGSWMSYYFAILYQQYYNIPGLNGKFSLKYILMGTLLSLAFSLFAGYQGCKGVLVLSPAEAMKAPTPKFLGKTWLEQINFFWQALNTQGKMAVRNVFRNKSRSILTIFGIAIAFSMIVSSQASFDGVYFLINFQYEKVEKYDIKVGLKNYVDIISGMESASNLNGVISTEPLLEVPVTISHKWMEKDTAITGLPRGGQLYQLVNDQGESVSLPNSGLVLSEQLAKKLKVNPGDSVNVKPFFGERDVTSVTVKKIVPLYVGLGAYMDIDQLSKMLRSSTIASSILIKAKENKINEVRKELLEGKNISAIHDKSKLKAQFEKLMESSSASKFILLFFAFVMGFAIVYNGNIISLSEREKEMATLMVLGMTEREIALILVFEQIMLGGTAILVGIPLAYGMLWAIINSTGSDIFNMPLVMNSGSISMGVAGTILFLVLAQWRTTSRIGKLSMLDVLKQQD